MMGRLQIWDLSSNIRIGRPKDLGPFRDFPIGRPGNLVSFLNSQDRGAYRPGDLISFLILQDREAWEPGIFLKF